MILAGCTLFICMIIACRARLPPRTPFHPERPPGGARSRLDEQRHIATKRSCRAEAEAVAAEAYRSTTLMASPPSSRANRPTRISDRRLACSRLAGSPPRLHSAPRTETSSPSGVRYSSRAPLSASASARHSQSPTSSATLTATAAYRRRRLRSRPPSACRRECTTFRSSDRPRPGRRSASPSLASASGATRRTSTSALARTSS